MPMSNAIFVLFMLFFSVGSFAAEDAYVFTEEKTGIGITSTHPQFIIKLKSNPTTGYSWFMREYDNELVQPIRHTFEAPKDSKLAGAPGYELWTFRMKPAAFVVPQQTVLRFVYVRPWEGSDSVKQVVFRVSTSSG